MDENASFILEIAEQGSISGAAETIHISQSALSQRLKQEEKYLGVELFNRKTLPIEPTEAGKIYLDWARGVVRSEQKMRSAIQSIINRSDRYLRVGISSGRCPQLLADVTAEFCQAVPDCHITYVEVGRKELIDAALVDGTIDFSVLTPQLPEPTLFSSESLCEERYVYVTPASWNLESITGSDSVPVINPLVMLEHPFIMPTFGRRLIQIIESIFKQVNGKPNIVCCCTSASMMNELIKRGIGATVLGTASGFSLEQSTTWYDIEGMPGRSYLYYSHHKGHTPSSDERKFMDILKKKLPLYPSLVTVQ